MQRTNIYLVDQQRVSGLIRPLGSPGRVLTAVEARSRLGDGGHR